MQKAPERINIFNKRLRYRIPMSNLFKNSLFSGKKLITYHNRFRKDDVEANLSLDDLRFLYKTCFFFSFVN
jgi:hypothetical protein